MMYKTVDNIHKAALPSKVNSTNSLKDGLHRGFLAPNSKHIIDKIFTVNPSFISAVKCKNVFEFGCGVGTFGRELSERFDHYTGIDSSAKDLNQFRLLCKKPTINLMCSDGCHRWPVTNNSVNLVFSSTAIHWLNADHVVSEVLRVSSHQGSVFVLGRVERVPGGWESILRKKCHQLLKKKQIKPCDGDLYLSRLMTSFTQKNMNVLKPKIVFRWQENRSLNDSFLDLQNKPGLAGVDVADKVKQHILSQLSNWASQNLKSDLPETVERQYVLYVVCIREPQK